MAKPIYIEKAEGKILAETDRKSLIFLNFDFALRAPPEELLIALAHELLHIIYPNRSEEEIQRLTIHFLVNNNLLIKHIEFIKTGIIKSGPNVLQIIADQDWVNS